MAPQYDFRLLTVGIDAYDSWGRIEASSSARRLVETLERFGALSAGSLPDPMVAGSRVSADEAERALESWFDEAFDASVPRNTVLYWGGHGVDSDGVLYLLTSETSDRQKRPKPSVRMEALRDVILNYQEGLSDGEWMLVILDCCGAGTGVDNLIYDFKRPGADQPASVGFLPAARHASSFSGRLTDAMDQVLASLTGADEEIALHELILRVSKELDNNEPFEAIYRLPADAVLVNRQSLGGGVASTERGRERIEAVLRDLPAEVRNHFLSKAQGTELDGEDWFFEGREQESRDLVRWLDESPSGLYVVTGWAGAGKSAFLGRMVVFAESALRAALLADNLMEEPPPDLVPALPFDAVIHLTANTFHDAFGRIRQTVETLTGSDLASAGVEEVLDALRGLDGQVSFLADALDEALDPIPIAESLLRRLAAIDGVRVVVGTRRSLNEGPDQPQPVTHELITALGARVDDESVVTLQNDQDAIGRYVTRRLRSTRSPYGEGRAAQITAQVVRREEPFLFARLATTELLVRPELSDLEIRGLLSSGHRGIFAAALDRLASLSPETVPLLRALAYSLGRGFPQRGRIWATVTEALHPTIEKVSEAAVDRARAQASDYLVHDAENGQATYRLAHRTFAEHFFDEP